jgi:sugar lactone lactonase YvrE
MRAAIVIVLTVQTAAFGQSIVTIAGGGTDDGRPATASQLSYPESVAVDAAGNLYIADAFHSRIRRVAAASGLMTTIAGNGVAGYSGDGGPALNASLSGSLPGIVVDPQGNVCFIDNQRIRRIAAGIITTIAGTGNCTFSGDGGPASAAALCAPQGIAFDRGGNLYVADYGNHRVRRISPDGIIATIAGTGRAEFSGDSGPAVAASLNDPGGVAFDAAGNLYIADTGNNRVRRVSADSGIIMTVAGTGANHFAGDGGPALSADIYNMRSAAVDGPGNLYISEYGMEIDNDRIRRVDAATGIINTYAGTGQQQFSGDGGPAVSAGLDAFGMALDTAGNLFIADAANNRIREVQASDRAIRTVAGNGQSGFSGDGGPAIAAALEAPVGLAAAASGTIYIADSNNARVRKVAGGIITTAAGNGSLVQSTGNAALSTALWFPRGVELDAAKNLYIVESDTRVDRVDAATGILTTFAGGGSTNLYTGDGGPAVGTGIDPFSVRFDAAGNAYIADTENERVRKVAAGSGIISTVAGNGVQTFSGDGGPATSASLSFPEDVAVDSAGNLYIADTVNNRIRKVDAFTGMISTLAGGGFDLGDGGPASAAGLSAPDGVAVDRSGNVYIADYFHHRVRRVDAATGVISTVAGNGSAGFSGDGGPATAAGLPYPQGVVVDGAGNLYISSGDRVRAVFACVTVSAPALQQPGNASASVNPSPKLAWASVAGAFHYDIYLDTVQPPRTIIAQDVTAASYAPANLQPLTTYYWRVVAKGDPFCIPFSSAASDVWSFTTTGTCTAPGDFTASVTPAP